MSTVMAEKKNQGCLFQLLWFAFVGIWLGPIWVVVAWILMVTIIGIPVGVAMINQLPKVIALREPDRELTITTRVNGQTVVRESEPEQINIFLRALYFILIGWWFSAVWMVIAYLLTVTIIGIPFGFWMFDRVPAILSLKR